MQLSLYQKTLSELNSNMQSKQRKQSTRCCGESIKTNAGGECMKPKVDGVQKPERARTNLMVTRAVNRRIRIICAFNDKTANQVIEEMLNQIHPETSFQTAA
jgi:hypothetical protein